MVTALCKSLRDSRAFHFIVCRALRVSVWCKRIHLHVCVLASMKEERDKKGFSPLKKWPGSYIHHFCSYPIVNNSVLWLHKRDWKIWFLFWEAICPAKNYGIYYYRGKRIMHMGTTGNFCQSPSFVTQASVCTHLPNHPDTKGDNANSPYSYWIQLKV